MHQTQHRDTVEPRNVASVSREPRFLAANVDLDGHRPLLTPAERESIRAQRDELSAIRDRDLPELLRDARAFVASDAAEEIAQINEDWAVVEARIAQLDSLLREARVVPPDLLATDVVGPGKFVTVKYKRTRRVATLLVSGTNALDGRTVSARSPIGRALLGHSPGERVQALLPHGRNETLEILSVGPALTDAEAS